jgi:hypothetical protein
MDKRRSAREREREKDSDLVASIERRGDDAASDSRLRFTLQAPEGHQQRYADE